MGREAQEVLRIEGIFDVPAAQRVRRALESAAPAEHVRVDLTRVEEFYDFGIAALAEALAGASHLDVEVFGLRQHQVRLLRYLGIPPEVFEPRNRALHPRFVAVH